MKFVVWIACILAFAAGLAVARDGAVRPAANNHTPNSVHTASADIHPGAPEACDGRDKDIGTEQCDDGNTNDGDGCDATGQAEFCGDGVVNNGWDSVPTVELIASDAAPYDRFGRSVSVSGDTAVVGAEDDDERGLAYVFGRNMGGVDAWGQVAKLTASDPGIFDLFGYSVSLDGDLAVVGAPDHNEAGSSSGSVYLFERNVGRADAWGQVARLTASDAARHDAFGISVSVSGDTVVVGAYLDDDAGSASGSVYVFGRNAGGADAWGQAAKLTAFDAAAGDWFGRSVSVSGDTVVVGAYLDDDAGSASGSVYVFGRNAGGADAWGQVAKLTASDAVPHIKFGISVSVSGNTVVVGAHRDNYVGSDSGSAYVFERDVGGADAWGQVAKLKASDAAREDAFGISVSVSGDTVVVGASGADIWSGSAYVFERNVGGVDTWGQAAKLTASDAATDDFFGSSVSVSGDTIVVGEGVEPFSPGSAYILTHGREECDDGNTADGDGCSSTCQTEMSPNLIATGGFERRVPWRFFSNGMGTFRVAGEEAVVTIGSSGSNTQLFQRFGGLAAGTYQLDFDVRSSVVTRARTILVNETDLSWIAQAGFRARPAWSHVTSTLVVPADVPPGMANARLSFYLPGVPDGTTLHFDNVVLKRVGPN